MQNRGLSLFRRGNNEAAREFFQRAIDLKKEVLGEQNPDLAGSISGLGNALKELGRFEEALMAQDRAIAILSPGSDLLFTALNNRGEALIGLRRYAQAETSLQEALSGFSAAEGTSSRASAFPLTALGLLKLATADPSDAASYFERALQIRQVRESDATLVAETRFGLARALWESGGDRVRALSLARSAHDAYAKNNRPRQLSAVDSWLMVHGASGSQSAGRRSRDLQ